MLIPYFAINPEARRPQLTMKRQKIPHLFAHLAVLTYSDFSHGFDLSSSDVESSIYLMMFIFLLVLP